MILHVIKWAILVLLVTCINWNLQATERSAEFQLASNHIALNEDYQLTSPLSSHTFPLSNSNIRFTFSLQNVTIKEIIRTIEARSPYAFMYNDLTLLKGQRLSISVKNATIEEVLNKLFASRSVEYVISRWQIILKDTSKEQITSNQHMVSGIVTDEYDSPLISATVSVKGTSQGTYTDLNGHFQIQTLIGSTLEVSYLGYTPHSVIVKPNAHFMVVTLKEDTQTLDELVVVGFGTQKKTSLTSAIAVISGRTLTRRPVVNTATMLQGQIPGLRVNQATGQPGAEGTTFRVRGQGTFSSAGSDPLVLINGVEGSITNLDPSMIESVSVLKDAASASIYGSRAANGVILVTTKQGVRDGDNKAHFSYHANIGIYTPIDMYDVVTNSVEYMELFNLAKKNSSMAGLYTQEMIDTYRNATDHVKYPNFDWLDYMFRPVAVQTHNLSIAGNAGKERKTTYNVSLNFVNQPGTMKGFEYKKYNMTVDLTSEITDFIKIGTYHSIQYGDHVQPSNGGQDMMISSLSQAPTYMPRLPDDGSGIIRYTNTAYGHEKRNKNVAAILNEGWITKNRSFDINSQLWMNIKLFKGLNWYSKAAVRLQENRRKLWYTMVNVYNYHTGQVVGNIGLPGLTDTSARTLYTNLYTYLNYDAITANKAHDFNLMLGFSCENNKFEDLSGYRKYFAFDLPVLNAGANDEWRNSGNETEWALMSFFARFKYAFKDRYLFEANMRYDGTSRIFKDNRWGIFPSFSGAWRLTEEKFIKNLDLKWLNNVKIRGSWGQLGNQNIGLYPYQTMISHVTDYPFNKKDVTVAYAQTNFTNRDIKWETTTITDIGADITVLNGLNVTFDWYNKETKDILRPSQVSGLLGMGAPTINKGVVRNRGIELAVNYSNMIRNGFLNNMHYTVGGYVDRTRNELITFGAEEISDYHIRREGLPYNQYYMLECIGIFADENEIKNAPKQFNDKTRPGDLRYKDVNKDGVISWDDRTPMGGQFPKFEYGFNLSADWNGFDLSILTQGVAGKSYYTDNWGVRPFIQGSAPTRDYVKGMWTEENPNNATYPRLYFENLGGPKNNRPNSWFLSNASYFRLKNVTLGYTLPRTWTQKLKLSKVRFYFSGDNMLTFTNYRGLDPERGGDGVEVQYPQNKIYSFGLNVEF